MGFKSVDDANTALYRRNFIDLGVFRHDDLATIIRPVASRRGVARCHHRAKDTGMAVYKIVAATLADKERLIRPNGIERLVMHKRLRNIIVTARQLVSQHCPQ